MSWVLIACCRPAKSASVRREIFSQCAIAVLFFAAFAGRSSYADVALWLASFSYLAALIWARYLERGLL